MIERCHRSSAPKRATNSKRPIFASFYSWEDSSRIVSEFNILSRKKGFQISVDQKYGEITTALRNKALKERKLLKNEKTISSGFISYPAKLYVKYDKKDVDYKLYKEFTYEDFTEG